MEKLSIIEEIVITSDNKDAISACDLQEIAQVGDTYVVINNGYNVERSNMLISGDRAGITFGGDAVWGDYAVESNVLTLDAVDYDGNTIKYTFI